MRGEIDVHIKTTSNEVVNLIYLLENKNDIQKTKFLIYIFDLLNKNKIKNEEVIFNFDTIGYSSAISKLFIYYLVAIYNHYDLNPLHNSNQFQDVFQHSHQIQIRSYSFL